mmetsp:Transcript_27779/g.41087  ORF Transcript_27779/g.41087 Transcript_27779/m.41087 type:complete len:411 (-) Transcript_27779:736-1968(-)
MMGFFLGSSSKGRTMPLDLGTHDHFPFGYVTNRCKKIGCGFLVDGCSVGIGDAVEAGEWGYIIILILLRWRGWVLGVDSRSSRSSRRWCGGCGGCGGCLGCLGCWLRLGGLIWLHFRVCVDLSLSLGVGVNFVLIVVVVVVMIGVVMIGVAIGSGIFRLLLFLGRNFTATGRTGLLLLQPLPKTIKVKDMATRQLLAFIHMIPTNNTYSTHSIQFLLSGIIKPFIHVTGKLPILDKTGQLPAQVGVTHPQIPKNVNRHSVIREHNSEENQIKQKLARFAPQLQRKRDIPSAVKRLAPCCDNVIDDMQRVRGKGRHTRNQQNGRLEPKQNMHRWTVRGARGRTINHREYVKQKQKHCEGQKPEMPFTTPHPRHSRGSNPRMLSILIATTIVVVVVVLIHVHRIGLLQMSTP